MRRFLFDNFKNIPGWRTEDKLVVFAVDDYGSVRLDSAFARERLRKAGLDMWRRFDRFDALETRLDLEALFDMLSSVNDERGKPAIFTPYVLSANPDFDALLSGRTGYQYELLPETFAELCERQPEAYSGAWEMWQEGIRRGFLKPQFHGREHFNVELFERKLKADDPSLKLNIVNRSLAALEGEPSMPDVEFTQAFGLSERSQTAGHQKIIEDGLLAFKKVFSFESSTFTPPAQQLHPDLYSFVESLGVKAIDKPMRCVRRLDRDEFRREINLLGQKKNDGHVTVVRNVVFEPTNDRATDSVKVALDQVACAFRWRKPAIISSHRVNFCGHIDPENRKYGLAALKRLLDGIVNRWPDVQFISADKLVDRVRASL